MKKTVVTILIVIVLVLALAGAGFLGFRWYQDNHVFVEGDAYPLDSQTLDLTDKDISIAYYNELQEKLPDCEITWVVPFQGRRIYNTVEGVDVAALTLEDVELLSKYFPNLEFVGAAQSTDYDVLEVLKAQMPDVEVIYQVSLGGKSFDPDTTQLVLEVGDYDLVTMMTNLVYLPDVTSIQLKMPEISLEQVEEIRAAYPQITVTCTVDLLGQEYDTTTTELDLSAMTSDQVADVLKKLPMLPNLTAVNLMDANGTTQLTKEDVKTLMTGAPNVVFHYTFDFFGHTLSTADEEIHIKNTKIGEEGVPELRAALDILTNCKRMVLEYCQIPNETMAQLRDDYRDRTKIVWRVSYGEGTTLTDAEVIRAVYNLVDDNCHNLVYCEDAKYMDIGHNEWLDACEFVSGMKSLEYVVISGAPIKSLEPFRNCKNLRMLEAAFCEYITDVSPLAECENLQMLNISNTHVEDLSPLDDLPLTHLTVRTNPSGKCRLSQEEQDRVIAQHPDCWISFSGPQPYGVGWRYDEDELTALDHYKVVREVFRLDLDPNIPNHVGWYLKDEERAEVEALEASMDATLEAMKAAPAEETQPEETVPEETAAEETVPETTVTE